MEKILITGATGQIGSELVLYLRDLYGNDKVVAAGHRSAPCDGVKDSGPYITLDVRDRSAIEKAVAEQGTDTIFHLAAMLSAMAEEHPRKAWEINMDGLLNVLEVAREKKCAVFFPSSIGAFGPSTPSEGTPQETIQRPQTVYGITKVSGELLCDYYFRRYGVDTRGLRYPGLISYETLPGGGTTDYAVEIFYAALTEGSYSCYLEEGTGLDMMYMPDAVRAAAELMEADLGSLEHRNAFNITAMSIGPGDLAEEIRKSLPGFSLEYSVDPLRQSIADGWPRHVDDSAARREWGWKPRFDLTAMVSDMLTNLSTRLWKDGYGLGDDLEL
jgi:nucleoside-diphosphate-sugar epimerase